MVVPTKWVLCVGLLWALNGQAQSLAADEERFMSVCLNDATVAASLRQPVCDCVFAAYAWGDTTRFGTRDLLSLPERTWEAPARRLPDEGLGRDIRRVRQQCLDSVRQRPTT